MNKLLRFGSIGSVLLALATVASASATEHSAEQTFALKSSSLNIVQNDSSMPIRITSGSGLLKKEISVKVDTKVRIQSAQTPAWSLNNGNLNLDTPCGGSIFGYCQATYLVTVPAGTEVKINGKPASVN